MVVVEKCLKLLRC